MGLRCTLIFLILCLLHIPNTSVKAEEVPINIVGKYVGTCLWSSPADGQSSNCKAEWMVTHVVDDIYKVDFQFKSPKSNINQHKFFVTKVDMNLKLFKFNIGKKEYLSLPENEYYSEGNRCFNYTGTFSINAAGEIVGVWKNWYWRDQKRSYPRKIIEILINKV